MTELLPPTEGAIGPAMVRVMRAIADEGIAKSRKNTFQGYQFRGVDEVMNAFGPLLAAEGIFIAPSFSGRTSEVRPTKADGTQEFVTLHGTFRFIAEDGSCVIIGPIYGEAADSSDKATNKAMAVAFKYALFQAFCVPLEGVTGGDADASHPEMARHNAEPPKRAARPTPPALPTVTAPPRPEPDLEFPEGPTLTPDDEAERIFGASETEAKTTIPPTRWDAIGEMWHDKGTISEAQRKRLYALARANGWTSNQVKDALEAGLTIKGTEQIPWGKPYNAICAIFEEFKP